MSQESINTATQLIQGIDQDRRLAKEVLQKLPEFVRADENTDVLFRINPDVSIPSLKKIAKTFENGQGMTSINHRIAQAERQIINVIGETVRIGQMLGKNRLSASWTSMDLMASNADGDTQNPLYSAAVDGGLRFAPEANVEKPPKAKISNTAYSKDNWLTANFTEQKEVQVSNTSSTSYNDGLYNYLMRNMTISEVTRQQMVTRSYTTTETRTEKYGGYYKWQTHAIYNRDANNRELHQRKIYVEGGTREVTFNKTHYYSAVESYVERVKSYSMPETQSLNGDFAVIGQTFYLPTAKVVIATEYFEYSPQSVSGIERKYLLCRCKYGQPLLNDVIARGEATIRANGSPEAIRVNWDKPVLLNAGEQVAFVILFKNNVRLYTRTIDNNRTGQLMTTKDYYHWEKLMYNLSGSSSSSYYGSQDITTIGSYGVSINQSMDLCFSLIVAQFSSTSHEIAMPNFELTGGISTAKVDYVAQLPEDNNVSIETMVKVNNRWEPLSVLDRNINLPPSTEAKLVLRGTRDVMPLIDTERTVYTLFRPKNNLTYVTKERTRPSNNVVKLALEVAGYDSRYHQIDCVLLLGNNHREIRPTVTISGNASDNSTGSRRYEFSLPSGRENYRIKVTASTSNASFGFDISSIVEFH